MSSDSRTRRRGATELTIHRRGAIAVKSRLPSHLTDMAAKPASLAGYAAACVRWRVSVTWAHVVLLLIVNVAALQLLFRNLAELQGENAALRMREEGLRAAGPRGYVLQEPRRLFMKKRNRKPQWRWVRGPGVKWGVGLKRLLELEASPERWGAECRAFATRAPTQRVLVAVPFRESMPDSITERLASLLGELECGSAAAGFQLTLGLTSASAPKESRDLTGRGRISAVRSGLVARFLRPEHAYVLWRDADIVAAPPDLVARLHAANPGGVSAPAVVIEDSNSSAYHQRRCGRDDCSAFNGMVGHKGYQFYDAAAFFEAGHVVRARRSKDEVRRLGHSNTGTVRVWPPYMGNRTDAKGNGGVVDCESVGTVYLVPAEVYRCGACPPGVRFEHFPTAFTEHFPIVHAARHYFGLPVVADLRVVAQHADLPAHGEGFHGAGTPDEVGGIGLARAAGE